MGNASKNTVNLSKDQMTLVITSANLHERNNPDPELRAWLDSLGEDLEALPVPTEAIRKAIGVVLDNKLSSLQVGYSPVRDWVRGIEEKLDQLEIE